jgi:hypothetical protein
MNPQAAAGRPDDGSELRIMRMLERAFASVEPPDSFVDQLESRLADVEAAAMEALGELSDWELDAMRDPRNWVRPVAAAAIGSGAAVGLVLVRTQRRRHKRRKESDSAVDLLGRTMRDLAREARRVADDVF